MWMAYAEASRPTATDLRTSIIRAESQFSDLVFYYEHESVYNFWSYCSSGLEELAKSAKLYERAASLCREFLDGEISVTNLIAQLDRMKLDTEEIKKFKTLEDRNDGGKI